MTLNWHYKGITTTESRSVKWFNNRDDESDAESYSSNGNNPFSEDYAPVIKTAELNITGGATEFILRDSTSKLFESDVSGKSKYSLSSTEKGSSRVLNFKMTGKSKWDLKKEKSSEVSLKLNTHPVWNINIELGAGSADFDLSAFKIGKLVINSGAAAFKVKLPQPIGRTDVSVETGVSDINISIPRSAACKINTSSGLSSTDFEGFTKQPDGSFTTGNFKESANIIVINLEGGLSNFEVNRY